MIIATFNVENLFERPRAMNFPTWRMGQGAIDAAGELNALINRRVYRDTDKRRLLHLLRKHQLLAARPNNPLLELRKVRGKLFERSPKPSSVVSRRSSGRGVRLHQRWAIESRDGAVERRRTLRARG